MQLAVTIHACERDAHYRKRPRTVLFTASIIASWGKKRLISSAAQNLFLLLAGANSIYCFFSAGTTQVADDARRRCSRWARYSSFPHNAHARCFRSALTRAPVFPPTFPLMANSIERTGAAASCSEEWGAEHLGAGPLHLPLEYGTHAESRSSHDISLRMRTESGTRHLSSLNKLRTRSPLF